MRNLAETFSKLAAQWSADTGYLSSITMMAMHPAYQQIIGLGPAVVPLILDRLKTGSGEQWFWALQALTGDNPVTEEMAGQVQAMAAAWIHWGETRGLRRISVEPSHIAVPETDVLAWQHWLLDLLRDETLPEAMFETIDALRDDLWRAYEKGPRMIHIFEMYRKDQG